jgi:uncharacterized membrane protein YkvA (DUF1232 family)
VGRWGLLRTFAADARLAWRLLREPRVSPALKALPVLAVLYLLSPIDVLPDIVPGLGQLDDLGVLVLAVNAFVRLAPSAAALFHRDAIARKAPYEPMAASDGVIDAQFRREP